MEKIRVDVQRVEVGDFCRYFATIEEAEKYADHLNRDREGYVAQVRYVTTDKPLQGRELKNNVIRMLKNI